MSRDLGDVAHDARPEPDAAVEGLVCVAGDEAGVGRGVECPCLGAGSISSHELEVFGVDEGLEGWFFRGAVRCRFGGFICWGGCPFFRDCGCIENALQGIGREAFFDDRRSVDGGVGLRRVASSIFIYYCTLFSV